MQLNITMLFSYKKKLIKIMEILLGRIMPRLLNCSMALITLNQTDPTAAVDRVIYSIKVVLTVRGYHGVPGGR